MKINNTFSKSRSLDPDQKQPIHMGNTVPLAHITVSFTDWVPPIHQKIKKIGCLLYQVDPLWTLPYRGIAQSNSDKFVIRETFDEVKNLTFGYNTGIIRK
jgi:hypothetical protein